MSKVIPFDLKASLFYNKGVQAAERGHYDKALYFFKRAAEAEPENPVHHCNVAGILSEMGRYEESNQILQHILQNIAPTLYECYYFIANNYTYLDQFEKAESYALRYLSCDPEGPYASEAEELLEYLSFEMGRPSSIHTDPVELEKAESNDRARKYLEEGKLNEAEKILRATVSNFPDFLPARNNLSLTYYYIGKMEKAIAEAQKVLEIDENNLHAICNLAIFYKQTGEKSKLEPLLDGLSKLYPIHMEHIYKLATTLGILGDHQNAYRLFYTLYRNHGILAPSLIHQIAVAAYNQGNREEAREWWMKLSLFKEAEAIGQRYLKLLDRKVKRFVPLGYRYPGDYRGLEEEGLEDEDRIDEEVLAIVEGILITMRHFWPSEYLHLWPEAEKRLWTACNLPSASLKKIRTWSALAAAIEYVVLSKESKVSKKEIAERYGISVSTLNKYIDQYV